MTHYILLDRILFEAKNGQGKRQDPHISQDYERAYLRLRNELLIKAETKESYILLPEGERAIELGGYENWLAYAEQKKTSNTTNTLNFHAPIMGSVVNQDSSFGDLSGAPTILTTNNPAASTAENVPKNADQKTSSLNIWQKVYKWTDHKLISIIIGGLLAVAGTYLLKWFLRWLN